ncbi:bi-domain-containing oxidoreductase [Spirosoma sp. KUDC1026]|uniref:bi-domain-containing oxidoreductase n=1 Tax=Spirosoma sp. KUDC1026 TaxID=2745947 RepID=UPI00159B8CB0|nr:bi-domain-containing oxidoreductase [Spirosoma sp. KUDC1026]QKZ12678.1 Gfo/Idh/MocA family oxidoreductase [Spirosoma sp. KUDC1026]
MKQLIQDLRTGETRLTEVPVPTCGRGQVLIQTRRSLVSMGTERMLVEFGRGSLLTKAWQQPDRVREVLAKVRADGLWPTVTAVRRKLDQPLPLGYCNVGTVVALGEGIADLRIGDRVVSNGPHAEFVCVPRMLVAPVPDGISDDEAAFAVIGAVGIHAVHLLKATLGETAVVIGLGLVGLLTADLLRINGCRVIGIEPDSTKRRLAEQRGVTVLDPYAIDPVKAVLALTNGAGADGVIVATATQSNDVLAQAARMNRGQGRIILVGTAGLSLNRTDFYRNEVTFQVACSYGPGRYDESYEQRGMDYPLPYVRWTANRNFEAVLAFIQTGQLDVASLISAVVPLENYYEIYSRIDQLSQPSEPVIAQLLTYPGTTNRATIQQLRDVRPSAGAGVVGVIGAGNFSTAVLVPALKRVGADLRMIASKSGLSATLLARKFDVPFSTSDYEQLLNEPAIDLCVIATRHNSHARLAIEAMRAGKHVFVEKPLVITEAELSAVIAAQQTTGRMVMVGFNRRFAPLAEKMKSLLGGPQSVNIPMNIVATMNAGAVPDTSWVHDRFVGGGRILGEACHYVDLITFLTGSRVRSVCMNAMGKKPTETTDSGSLLLQYENGSTGVLNYFANGSKAYAKERVEVYSLERTLVLENFRTLRGYGFPRFSKQSGRQDKGHTVQMQRLLAQLRTGGEPLIPFAELINTSQTMLAALQSLREQRWVDVASADSIVEPIPIGML